MTRTNYNESPYFLDIYDLKRERANERDIATTLELPEDMTNNAQGVNQNTTVQINGKLHSVEDGIYFTGTISAPVWSRCSVCDDQQTNDVKLPINAFYLYEDKVVDDDIDAIYDEYFLIESRYIDLVQLIRDTLYESYEFAPVCSDECAEKPKVYTTDNENQVDERLSALSGLLQDLEKDS